MAEVSDVGRMSINELLVSYERIIEELKARKVVRTGDAPAGQFAEWLARVALGGVLPPNATKAYDLDNEEFHRLQVKCRVLRKGTNSERQLSPFRSTDVEYDHALIILFGPTYNVLRAVVLSSAQVSAMSKHQAHVNGQVLIATDAVLAHGVDITSRLNPTTFVDIAQITRTEAGWVDLAATYDGYAENGSFEAADGIWKSVTAKLAAGSPCCLDHLRTALFMEYRADRHGGGIGERTPAVTALIEAIHTLTGGTVLTKITPPQAPTID